MNIVARAQWGARRGDGQHAAPLPADEVWLHHSVTIAPDLVPPFADDYAAIRTIERIGAERFGQAYGFPYTFAITPAGLVFAGHDIAKTGAHTAGHNTRGRGICLVGNYEETKPPAPMLDALVWLLRHGHAQGWWRSPRLDGGHRDVKATACPGRHAYALINNINHRAANHQEDDMFNPNDRALLTSLARRADVGYMRDQLLTALGVNDPEGAPPRRSPQDNAAVAVARRADVGHARDQLVERLTRIEAKLDELLERTTDAEPDRTEQ